MPDEEGEDHQDAAAPFPAAQFSVAVSQKTGVNYIGTTFLCKKQVRLNLNCVKWEVGGMWEKSVSQISYSLSCTEIQYRGWRKDAWGPDESVRPGGGLLHVV